MGDLGAFWVGLKKNQTSLLLRSGPAIISIPGWCHTRCLLIVVLATNPLLKDSPENPSAMLQMRGGKLETPTEMKGVYSLSMGAIKQLLLYTNDMAITFQCDSEEVDDIIQRHDGIEEISGSFTCKGVLRHLIPTTVWGVLNIHLSRDQHRWSYR